MTTSLLLTMTMTASLLLLTASLLLLLLTMTMTALLMIPTSCLLLLTRSSWLLLTRVRGRRDRTVGLLTRMGLSWHLPGHVMTWYLSFSILTWYLPWGVLTGHMTPSIRDPGWVLSLIMLLLNLLAFLHMLTWHLSLIVLTIHSRLFLINLLTLLLPSPMVSLSMLLATILSLSMMIVLVRVNARRRPDLALGNNRH